MKLKLSCADFTFPLLPHDDVLDLIAKLGVEGVDIGLFEGGLHIQPSGVIKDIAGSARDLSRRVEDRGLVIADIFPILNASYDKLAINDPLARVRRKAEDWFKRILEYTVRTGAGHMTILPGVPWEKREAYSDSLNRCAEELAWRVEMGRSMGVTVSIEAHLESIVPTPKQAMALLRKTPGLTLTLDYGHFVYQGFKNSEIHPLIPHATHFHARSGAKNILQGLLSENTIDYPQILRRMKQSNYPGYVGLEYVWEDWEDCNRVDNLSETIQLRDLLLKVKLSTRRSSQSPHTHCNTPSHTITVHCATSHWRASRPRTARSAGASASVSFQTLATPRRSSSSMAMRRCSSGTARWMWKPAGSRCSIACGGTGHKASPRLR